MVGNSDIETVFSSIPCDPDHAPSRFYIIDGSFNLTENNGIKSFFSMIGDNIVEISDTQSFDVNNILFQITIFEK